MDKMISQPTREEVLRKLRRRYETAGAEHKRKLLDQAQELLGYHRKSAIRALRTPALRTGPVILSGRPVEYEPQLLVPWLRPIWQATDYACGRRLVAMLPEWIPAYEQYERRMPGEVRDKLLLASGRTLDRLLEPLRGQARGRLLTRPGTLLRQQIPIRGSVWEENKAGWLEVDTVALCGGSVAGEYVWMVDGVDYATTWVELRAMWGRGQAGTLAALQDMEAGLPFSLLGLDSVALMAFLGGLGTVSGPVLGALVIVPAQQYLTEQFTNDYLSQIVLGSLFLAVILLLPRGVIPTAREKITSWRARWSGRMAVRATVPSGQVTSPPGEPRAAAGTAGEERARGARCC